MGTSRFRKKSAGATDAITEWPNRLLKAMAGGRLKRFIDRRWPLTLVTSLLVALFVSPELIVFTPDYQEGEYVQRAVKARHSMTVEDVESTRARREQAAGETPPVYDINSETASEQARRLDDAFDRLGDALGFESNSASGEVRLTSRDELADARSRFLETLGTEALGPQEFQTLANPSVAAEVRGLARQILELSTDRYVVTDLDEFRTRLDEMPKGKRVYVVRDVATGKESSESGTEKVVDASAFEKDAERRVRLAATDKRAAQIAAKIGVALSGVNTTFNPAQTAKRRQDAREAVLPSLVKYAKNQVIVGEGEKITAEKLAILNQIHLGAPGASRWFAFAATASLVFLLQYIVIVFGQRNIRKFRVATRDLALLGLVVVGTALLARLGTLVSGVVTETFEFMPDTAMHYAMPVAATAMLVRIVLNSEVAIFAALIVSVIAGLLLGGDHAFTVYVLIGSVAGAHFVGRQSRRLMLLRAGLFVGLVNAATLVGLEALPGSWSDFASWSTLFDVVGGAVGGALCGVMVLAALPVVESLFGYTSNISLLELASLNHPLLKDMVLRAPGTYNHSTIVGSLAEAGAESIAANPLLAKVAAIYHDVGKLNKPEYFSENYPPDENPHDKLYPSMSVLILTSHVREGVELARRHRLGDQIVDVIRQHHGTSLIRKHFERAKQSADGRTSLNEEDFRYPGPRPQTREAALVMLANAVEVRAGQLPNPTPARLEECISDTINEFFLDGQLSESDLTLRDLGRVSKAFLKVLAGFYHSRIEYPEDANAKKRPLQVVQGHPGSNS
ncbi:MAG: HDIG domain-containing protein [Deltaproteobacteria bacterium]|nr:HDIG domain-containing protein [Deltaproteobacteria bacterium]